MPFRKKLKLEISALAQDDLRDIAQYTLTTNPNSLKQYKFINKNKIRQMFFETFSVAKIAMGGLPVGIHPVLIVY